MMSVVDLLQSTGFGFWAVSCGNADREPRGYHLKVSAFNLLWGQSANIFMCGKILGHQADAYEISSEF